MKITLFYYWYKQNGVRNKINKYLLNKEQYTVLYEWGNKGYVYYYYNLIKLHFSFRIN